MKQKKLIIATVIVVAVIIVATYALFFPGLVKLRNGTYLASIDQTGIVPLTDCRPVYGTKNWFQGSGGVRVIGKVGSHCRVQLNSEMEGGYTYTGAIFLSA